MPPKKVAKTGVQSGAGVDPAVVEQVKALKSLGYTDPHVAKQLGISVSTVRRYNVREDIDPSWAEARAQNVRRFVDENWDIVHQLTRVVREAAFAGDFKAKDAAITQAVLIDKISMLAPMVQQKGSTTETFEVKLTVAGKGNGESEHHGIPDTGEVLELPRAVSGDDMRSGGGEDLRRLPGGGEDGAPAEVRRGDSGEHIPEPA